jgi:Sulfotransferase domain
MSPVLRPKVFGLGFSKTGTSSLAQALTELGFKTIHNPTDDQTMLALLAGNLRGAAITKHDAICDIMFCRHFGELDRLYPGSTFILTDRNKAAWHASCARHWESRRITSTRLLNEELIDFYVYGAALYSATLFEDAYESHYRAVLEYFIDRPRQLLRINICGGEGWEPLCSHLGLKAPRVPFPHIQPKPWKAESANS